MERSDVPTTTASRVLFALIAGVLIAVAYTVFFSDDRTSMLFIGDLPGFYGLGRIVLEGHGDHLYDFEYQREAQNRFWPILNQTFFPTMYPPIVGLIVALVAWIPPLPLRVLLIFVEVSVLLLALRALARDRRVERFTLILFSIPILISLAGVQNTAISIGLISLARRLLARNQFLIAGLVAGALFYKPQVGLVICVVMAVGAGIVFSSGVLFSLLLQYVAGLFVYKGEWLLPWIEKIKSFSSLRASLDGPKMTSFFGHLAVDGVLGISQQSWELLGFGGVLIGILVYSLQSRTTSGGSERALGFLLGSFPVFVPQTMFYDLGISIFWVFANTSLATRAEIVRSVAVVLTVNICVMCSSADLSLMPIGALSVALLASRVFLCRGS